MAETPKRDWWLLVGMGVTAASAAVSSFSGLRALAVATGWPGWLAILLPATVDVYAMTATRVWLNAGTEAPVAARRFARWNALGAIALSLLGNGLYHLIATGVLAVSWPMVVGVGAVPPAVLGLLTHLAVLRTSPAKADQDRADEGTHRQDDQDEPDRNQDTTSTADDVLLAAARRADDEHRRLHGTPITRDTLRREMRISTDKATALLRILRSRDRQQPGTSVVNSTVYEKRQTSENST